MKKKLLSIVLAIFVVIFAIGCSNSPQSEDVVKTFLTDAQSFDLEKMQESIDPNFVDKNLNIKDWIGEDASRKATFEFLKNNAEKMTYKITDSKVDGDKATVSVDFKFVDGSKAFKTAFNEVLDEVMSKAFNGVSLTEEEIEELTYSALAKYEPKDNEFIESSLDLKCKKIKDKWYITDLDDDFFNILLSNILSLMN